VVQKPHSGSLLEDQDEKTTQKYKLDVNTPQTRHITHSSTPDQRPVNQSAKYHRQQPSV